VLLLFFFAELEEVSHIECESSSNHYFLICLQIVLILSDTLKQSLFLDFAILLIRFVLLLLLQITKLIVNY